jgi:hypothetical protein
MILTLLTTPAYLMPAVEASAAGASVPSGEAGNLGSGTTRMFGGWASRMVRDMSRLGVGRRTLTAIVVVIAVSACTTAGSRPPPAGVRPDGFPTGVFAKTFNDQVLGPMRLSWVFDADGNWAEVPEALAGQSFNTGPARGHYSVAGDLVTIQTDWPSFWAGWTRSHWTLDGDRLITRYDDSEFPADTEFQQMLDAMPWVRVP